MQLPLKISRSHFRNLHVRQGVGDPGGSTVKIFIQKLKKSMSKLGNV